MKNDEFISKLDVELFKNRPNYAKFDTIYENFDYKDYEFNCKCAGSFNKEFFVSLFDEIKPQFIIELGSYQGYSTIYMAELCKKYNDNFRLFCVDTWLGNWHYDSLNWKHGYPTLYHQFIANIHYKNLQNFIYPIPLPTSIAVNNIKETLNNLDLLVDLIYVDAGHDFFSVYSDCYNYYPLLKSSGIMFGDDLQSKGVKEGLDEFCKNNELKYIIDGINWIIKKI